MTISIGPSRRVTSLATALPSRRSARSIEASPSRKLVSRTSASQAGNVGRKKRICCWLGTNEIPSAAASNAKTDAADQACGAQASGYAVGPASLRRAKQAFQHLQRRGLEPVAREAEGDQRIVVRPHRTVVVGHRVVAGLARGNRADAPAGE